MRMQSEWLKATLRSFLCFTVFVTGSVFAADPGAKFYWKGGDGAWSDATKWYSDASCTTPAGRYPGSDGGITDDAAYFVSAMPGAKIDIDKDVTIYKLYVEAGSNSVVFDGGQSRHQVVTTSTNNGAADRNTFLRPVTFSNLVLTATFLTDQVGGGVVTIGAGTDVTCSDTVYLWMAGAGLVIEAGGTLAGKSMYVMSADCSVTINGGNCTGATVFKDGSGAGARMRFVINGGTNNIRFFATESGDLIQIAGGNNTLHDSNYRDGTVFEICGGTTSWDRGSTLAAGVDFRFTGGTMLYDGSNSLKDKRFLGSGDATLVVSGNQYDTVNVFTQEFEDLKLDSTLYVTNKTPGSSVFCGFKNTANGSVFGDGSMYVGRLFCYNVTNRYRLARISLGLGLFYYQTPSRFDFSQGANFGSWGNWSISCNSSVGETLFGGDLTIDTLDDFDGETAHTVSLESFRALPNTALSVTGGGSLTWKPLSGGVTDIKSLNVGEGTTFEPKSYPLTVGALSLGANAKVRLASGSTSLTCGSLLLDPSAQIEVDVSSSAASAYAGPIFNVGSEGCDPAVLAGAVKLSGDGAASCSVRTANGCVYYRNSTPYDYDAAASKYGANFWTGASAAGNCLNDEANWHSGSVPPSGADSTKIYFGGYDNLTITNDLPANYYFKQMRFVKDCGPVVIRGDPLQPSNYSYMDADLSVIVAQSPFPVTFETDILSKYGRFQVLADGGAPVSLNGHTSSSDGLFLRGHLNVGGPCHLGRGLYFQNSVGTLPTAIEVLDGGLLSVSNQTAYSAVFGNPFDCNCSFRVHRGGRIEFIDNTTDKGRSAVGWKLDGNLTKNVVDGEFDVQCPLIGWAPMHFSGTGTLNVDETVTTNVNSSLVLSGGITFTSRGAFYTSTENDANHVMNLIVDGEATLAAPTAPWTYGPANSHSAGSSVDRALLLQNADSVLTVASTNGYAIAFGDPIVGKGTLRFAEGAVIKPVGELSKTVWTEMARVGSVEGLPAAQDDYRYRTVQNADGTVSLEAKCRGGSILIVR